MWRFMREDRSEARYTDFSNVESQRNDIVPEEFPEGPYGMSLETETLGKSTPWRVDQRSPQPYGYENKQLHQELKRDYPGENSQESSLL